MARREDTNFDEDHPIHDSVFGAGFGVDPDGYYNDTPPGAIGQNVNVISTAVQPEGHHPMRHVGDTDQGERQPDGGRRR